MSCSHEHHHNGHGHSHDDDDHIKPGEGQQDFLYSRIDREGVVAMNEQSPDMGPKTIKPWDERNDETKFLETDVDDQLIIRIPFLGQAKLRSLLIKSGPADQTPESLYLYPNLDTLDFDEASSGSPAPTQKLESIAVTRDVVEYPLRTARFSSVRSLTIFVTGALGGDRVRIYFLGLKGEGSDLRREGPLNIVYESAPQMKDHNKVPGTDIGGQRFGPGSGAG